MCDHPNREAAMVVIDPGAPERLGRNGVWCDPCLEQLVRALNDGGIRTTASCCGHGAHLGWVMLADGRDLVIADHETHQRIADGISLTAAAAPDPRFRDQIAEAIYTAGDISGVPWERAKANPFREAKAMLQADAVITLVEARVQASANQRAAEELRAAADWIWDEAPALASASAELHSRAAALDGTP